MPLVVGIVEDILAVFLCLVWFGLDGFDRIVNCKDELLEVEGLYGELGVVYMI